MNRIRRAIALLSTGGMMLGVVQAFDMVSFAEVITRVLSTVLSLLVALLFGGDLANLEFGSNLTI